MELDELEEPEPTSTDELTSSTTFTEERPIQTTAPLPPPIATSLYDDANEEDINIPTESNQVGYLYIYR